MATVETILPNPIVNKKIGYHLDEYKPAISGIFTNECRPELTQKVTILELANGPSVEESFLIPEGYIMPFKSEYNATILYSCPNTLDHYLSLRYESPLYSLRWEKLNNSEQIVPQVDNIPELAYRTQLKGSFTNYNQQGANIDRSRFPIRNNNTDEFSTPTTYYEYKNDGKFIDDTEEETGAYSSDLIIGKAFGYEIIAVANGSLTVRYKINLADLLPNTLFRKNQPVYIPASRIVIQYVGAYNICEEVIQDGAGGAPAFQNPTINPIVSNPYLYMSYVDPNLSVVPEKVKSMLVPYIQHVDFSTQNGGDVADTTVSKSYTFTDSDPIVGIMVVVFKSNNSNNEDGKLFNEVQTSLDSINLRESAMIYNDTLPLYNDMGARVSEFNKMVYHMDKFGVLDSFNNTGINPIQEITYLLEYKSDVSHTLQLYIFKQKIINL